MPEGNGLEASCVGRLLMTRSPLLVIVYCVVTPAGITLAPSVIITSSLRKGINNPFLTSFE